eukprot:Pgem_evm1s20013
MWTRHYTDRHHQQTVPTETLRRSTGYNRICYKKTRIRGKMDYLIAQWSRANSRREL